MQKGKIADYQSFKNEINILMQLVSLDLLIRSFFNSFYLNSFILFIRITPILSSCTKPGRQNESAS